MNKLFGAFVCERLKDARELAGGTLPWPKVEQIIQSAFEQEAKAFTAFCIPPKRTVKKNGEPIAKRKRDEHIDALMVACGGDPFQATQTAVRACAVAMAEIKQVSPEVTIEEIKHRVTRYKDKHRDWPLTPSAISKHWHELGSSASRTHSAAFDPYIEPENWRERAKKVYPDADFEDRKWEDVGLSIRKEILIKS